MNAEERKEFLKSKRLILSDLKVLVEQSAKTRAEKKEEISKVTGFVDLTEEAKARRKNEINAKYAEKFQQVRDEITQKLNLLEKITVEANASLSITPELETAINLINIAGPDMDSETLRKLVSNFAGDQSTLKALQAVFKSRGFSYDGGLSNLLYDVGSSYQRLRELADMALIFQGSINNFAAEISLLAEKENLEFPSMVDAGGFENAARRGAGLPVE